MLVLEVLIHRSHQVVDGILICHLGMGDGTAQRRLCAGPRVKCLHLGLWLGLREKKDSHDVTWVCPVSAQQEALALRLNRKV